MKKQYIEPSTAVYTFKSIHMVATSSTEISGEATEEYYGGGDGNNDTREDNIFNNGGNIWDNAW